jgi:hypothetical protein
VAQEEEQVREATTIDVPASTLRITADVVDKVKQEAENAPNIPISELHTVGKIIYPRVS